MRKSSEAGCSKLKTSLINVLLKFINVKITNTPLFCVEK